MPFAGPVVNGATDTAQTWFALSANQNYGIVAVILLTKWRVVVTRERFVAEIKRLRDKELERLHSQISQALNLSISAVA